LNSTLHLPCNCSVLYNQGKFDMEGQDSSTFVHWDDFYRSDEMPQVKSGREIVGGWRENFGRGGYRLAHGTLVAALCELRCRWTARSFFIGFSFAFRPRGQL